ncbi:hypothetical protein ACWGIV_35880, partial [Streptomyces sp. NPDC054844]
MRGRQEKPGPDGGVPGRAAAVPPPVRSADAGRAGAREPYGGQAGGPAPAPPGSGAALGPRELLAIQGSAGNAAASLLIGNRPAPRPPDAAGGPLVV